MYGAARISHAGELHGISEIGSGRLFIFKRYGLVGFSHFPSSAQGTGLTPGASALTTAGFDAKLGLRSILIANFTVNTDFADADVDTLQFNLTPYKLFFPEKRQFFLENAGVFDFPLGGDSGDRLFFSRQIGIDPTTGQQVPVNGGARITGSLGKFELGAMDVDTRGSGPNPAANYAVLRLTRSLWGGSYIGFMGIDKRSSNPFDRSNQTSGVGARLSLLQKSRSEWVLGANANAGPFFGSDERWSSTQLSNQLDRNIRSAPESGTEFQPRGRISGAR